MIRRPTTPDCRTLRQILDEEKESVGPFLGIPISFYQRRVQHGLPPFKHQPATMILDN
jgi:hypothetical protein